MQLDVVALARWESDGGAVIMRSHASAAARPNDRPAVDEAAFGQLRVRLIAVESVLISLMAGAPRRQRDLARQMAEFISPRSGHTAHPVTLRAAAEIVSLAERAERIAACS